MRKTPRIVYYALRPMQGDSISQPLSVGYTLQSDKTV
jgi:hypothetical protein